MCYGRESCVLFVAFSVAVLLVAVPTGGVHALVTSSGGPIGGDHIVGPFGVAFGLDHRGVGRALLFDAFPTPGICTASLLEEGGGRFALTATHCLGDGDDIDVDSVTVEWETDSGVFVTATATKAAGQIHVNPSYSTTGDIFAGHDVALLEFTTPVSTDVPRYKLFDGSYDEVGVPTTKIGYGASGFGATGATIPAVALPSAGVKRAGKNTWEHTGLGDFLTPMGITEITENDTQLTYDFDNGATGDPANDAFGVYFGMSDSGGFGPDEVIVGLGDSGGPSFVPIGDGEFAIAGVASYITRLSFTGPGGTLELEAIGGTSALGTSSDITTSVDSSWGEFGVDARIANPDIRAFLDSVLPLTGDYNLNDSVDAADYTVWLDSLGSSTDLAADGNGNGFIDPGDYGIWKMHFGEVRSSAVASSSTVPEPTAWILLVVGMATLLCRPCQIYTGPTE